MREEAKRRFLDREHYDMEDFLALIRFLRSPEGCPWDRVQTHESLRGNLLEEAYEAVEAINEGVSERLTDELGDVLMQVVLHSQLGAEEGNFTFADVVDQVCRKLVRRHTHLFGDDQVHGEEEALGVWDGNKRLEKDLQTHADTLADVSRTLPALMRARKLQQRAANVGFDWSEAAGARLKIEEELAEMDAAGDNLEEEAGDFLFAAVNYLRLLGIDPEVALSQSSEKFLRRFRAMEEKALAAGLELEDLDLQGMDRLWDQVKTEEEGRGPRATR